MDMLTMRVEHESELSDEFIAIAHRKSYHFFSPGHKLDFWSMS